MSKIGENEKRNQQHRVATLQSKDHHFFFASRQCGSGISIGGVGTFAIGVRMFCRDNHYDTHAHFPLNYASIFNWESLEKTQIIPTMMLSTLAVLIEVLWVSSMAVADSVPPCSTFQTICVMNPDQSLMATDNNNDDRFITVPIDGSYYLSFQVTHQYTTSIASV